MVEGDRSGDNSKYVRQQSGPVFAEAEETLATCVTALTGPGLLPGMQVSWGLSAAAGAVLRA